MILWLAPGFLVSRVLSARARPRAPESVPPGADAFALEEVLLRTSDGEELALWHAEVAPDAPIVLVLHGNGGDRASSWEPARWCLAHGFSVALLALRAHGASSGSRNDFGWSARLDVLAACAWLEERGQGASIVVWGRSLGAAAAVFAGAELGPRVSAYVLECPYPDLATAVLRRLELRLPAFLPRAVRAGLARGARA